MHAFRHEVRNDEVFRQVNDDYRAANQEAFQLITVYWPGIQLIGNVTTAVLLLYGGVRVMNGAVAIGTLTEFILYIRRFFEPMAEVSQFCNSFQAAAAPASWRKSRRFPCRRCLPRSRPTGGVGAFGCRACRLAITRMSRS